MGSAQETRAVQVHRVPRPPDVAEAPLAATFPTRSVSTRRLEHIEAARGLAGISSRAHQVHPCATSADARRERDERDERPRPLAQVAQPGDTREETPRRSAPRHGQAHVGVALETTRGPAPRPPTCRQAESGLQEPDVRQHSAHAPQTPLPPGRRPAPLFIAPEGAHRHPLELGAATWPRLPVVESRNRHRRRRERLRARDPVCRPAHIIRRGERGHRRPRIGRSHLLCAHWLRTVTLL